MAPSKHRGWINESFFSRSDDLLIGACWIKAGEMSTAGAAASQHWSACVSKCLSSGGRLHPALLARGSSQSRHVQRRIKPHRHVYLLRWQVRRVIFRCWLRQQRFSVCSASKRSGLQRVASRYQRAKRGPFETLHQPLRDTRKDFDKFISAPSVLTSAGKQKSHWLFRHASSAQ